LAVISALSIVHTSCGTQVRAQSVTCPCNFDLEFWTRDEWVLTANGLFDSCGAVTSDQTEIFGLQTIADETGSGFLCNAVQTAQTRTTPGECRAIISCIAIGGPGIIDIYLQIENITPEEFQQCSNDILAVAAALNIPCPLR